MVSKTMHSTVLDPIILIVHAVIADSDWHSLVWSANPAQRSMIAFSPLNSFSVYLPTGDGPNSSLILRIVIRDQLQCIAQWPLISVIVRTEPDALLNLIQDVNAPSSNNPFLHLLSVGNQNSITQLIQSLAQQVNLVTNHVLDQLLTSTGDRDSSVSSPMIRASLDVTSPASLAVSPLSPTPSMSPSSNSILNNITATVDAYQHQINQQASLREYLIAIIEQLPITSTNVMKMQASSLAQLTASTNELTRNSLVMPSFDAPASTTKPLRSDQSIRALPRSCIKSGQKCLTDSI
jgi:hypothetical protein